MLFIYYYLNFFIKYKFIEKEIKKRKIEIMGI
jgi:hypothetical protein